MKHRLLLPSLILLTFASCGPKNLDQWMVPLSDFNMNPTALRNGEEIEIIGGSGNLTEEHTIDFYNLVVVRSLETGDTVNVLVTTFFRVDPNDRTMNFISNTTETGMIAETALSNSESLDKKNVRDLQPKKYNRVLYDSEYIQADVRKYPTVTGILAHMTLNDDSLNSEEKE